MVERSREGGFFLFLFLGFFGFGGGFRIEGAGFAQLLDVEGIVGEEEDVALMEKPEKVCGEFSGRRGAALGQDSLPETLEFGGLVGAYPSNHDAWSFGEDDAGWQWCGASWAGEEFALAFEDREVFGLHGAADRGNEDGGMVSGMVARQGQRSEE